MNKLKMINEQFGSAEFVKVAKPVYSGRTLTGAIFNVSKRLDETIDALTKLNDIRKIPAKTFNTPMCKKKKGNLIVKVGYGANNRIMDPLLDEQKYARVSDALDYLFQIRTLLREGELDDIIEHNLDTMKANSKYARSFRAEAAEAKKTTNLESPEPKQIEHMVKIENRMNDETIPNSLERHTTSAKHLQLLEQNKKAG